MQSDPDQPILNLIFILNPIKNISKGVGEKKVKLKMIFSHYSSVRTGTEDLFRVSSSCEVKNHSESHSSLYDPTTHTEPPSQH